MTRDADLVFKALADTTRRQLLDRLFEENGQSLTRLCERSGMTRQGVAKHLAHLEAAGLVVKIWHGREALHYLNPAPIQEIHQRWIHKYVRARVQALQDLKDHLEEQQNE